MKRILLALLLTASPCYADCYAGSTHIIKEDFGGSIPDYIDRYDNWKTNGDIPIIDGICASACAYVTRVPLACASENGMFIFHEAYTVKHPDKSVSHQPHIYNEKIRKETFALYPTFVQKELLRRGGLKKTWLFIRAEDLLPECKG